MQPRPAARMLPLAEHHRHLERTFEDLVRKATDGDPAELRSCWLGFESELLAHLDYEEAELLPGFEERAPHEAAAIRREHEEIRAVLLEMGINLDLHLMRLESVRDFVMKLRAHANREEESFYAWAATSPQATSHFKGFSDRLVGIATKVGKTGLAKADLL